MLYKYTLQLPDDNHFNNNLMTIHENKIIPTTNHKLMTFKMISQGTYTDMNGNTLEVTDEIIESLMTNYNTEIESRVEEHNRLADEGLRKTHITADSFEDFKAMTKDHDIKLDNVIGKIYGKLWIHKSLGRLSLFGNIHVMDKEAYHNFIIGLWSNTSIAFDQDFNIHEYSAVTYGADSRSKIMFSNPDQYQNNKNNLQNKLSYDKITLINNISNKILEIKLQNLIDKYITSMSQDLKLKPFMASELRESLQGIKDVQTVAGILQFMQRYLQAEKTCTTYYVMKKEDSNGNN